MLKRRIALPLIGVLLVAVVFAPIPGEARWIGALHDTAHGPIFGSVALLLLWGMRQEARLKWTHSWTGYAVAFLGSLLLGVMTELAQHVVGRDASLGDAGRDAAGAIAFLMLFAAFDTELRPRTRAYRLLVLLALPLLLVGAKPGIDAAIAYARRAHQFPTLAEFSTRLDDYFIQAQWSQLDLASLPHEYARQDGERALRVQFEPGPYPGVDFFEPAPDWSGYTTLTLDIANPSASPLELLLRVHDAEHTKEFADRFNKVLHVAPLTRATLEVPLEEIRSAPQGRAMDIQHIAGLLFFRTESSSAVTEIYLARIGLE